MKHFATVSILCLAGLAPAFALNSRSWVASNGSDLAACTRLAPCLTFAQAVSQTNAGGEVNAVDSADYGPFAVSVAMTIDGGPALASISGTNTFADCPAGATAVCVKAPGGTTVKLRNLSINVMLANANAIVSVGTGTLQIVSVEVSATAFHDCISVSAGALTIKDSTITHCGGNGVAISSNTPLGPAILENVLIQGVQTAGVYAGSAKVEVRNSNVSGGFYGVEANGGAVVTVDSTSVADNLVGIDIFGGVVQLSNVTVTGNNTGILLESGGPVISFVNNRIYNNTTNGAPTQSVYQK